MGGGAHPRSLGRDPEIRVYLPVVDDTPSCTVAGCQTETKERKAFAGSLDAYLLVIPQCVGTMNAFAALQYPETRAFSRVVSRTVLRAAASLSSPALV